MKRIILALFAIAILPAMLFAQTTEFGKPTMDLFDNMLNPGDSVHLDSNHVWILKDGVFVDSGAVLSIDPGTVIKGEPGTGVDSKYLCVARGGRIRAEGTENKPIIFTGDVDNVDDPYDIAYGTNGLWGGLLILGRSVTNTPSGTNQIEGIPTEEPRGNYGGGLTPDSLDNSGIIRYVSIRHGGTEIGAANEINGLTMGAVGAGTVIEYVEVYNNYDDGFEWFGGTVNTKYLVSAFNGDDSYDYDEGFRGYHQFWFAIQDSASANALGEHDGAIGDEQGTPYAEPYIFNCTYIGSGANTDNADNDHALQIRDNAGGHYANGIIGYYGGDAVNIEDRCGASGTPHDSRERLEVGDLTLENMFFYDYGDGPAATDLFPVWSYDCDGVPGVDSTSDFNFQYMTDPAQNNNWTDNPMLMNVDRHQAWHLLDPRLDPMSPANTPGQAEPADPHFDDVDYHGAFPPATSKNSLAGLWISKWTYMWQRGHVALICGDANRDTNVNVSDAVFVVNYVFLGGSAPFPFASADANCDCGVNVSDAVKIVNYVFIGGAAPCTGAGCPHTCVF